MATTNKGAFQAPVTRDQLGARPQIQGFDATDLLMQDHHEARTLFKRFKSLTQAGADARTRKAVADKVCQALLIHTQIEEEIFYPAARAAKLDSELMDEANVEHDAAKDLIAQVQSMGPDDAFYNAKVNVLGEYIDLHATEEEQEMFPKARRSQMDLDALGKQLQARKDELTREGPARLPHK